MASISLDQLLKNSEKYIDLAHQGALFVYPTDTIYGLGAIVSPESIEKITVAKQRQGGKHYSVIAPSFKWIEKCFEVSESFQTEWEQRKEKFPGRGLTLLLPVKDKDFLLSLLSPSELIGVRIIDHPFQQFITDLEVPFITTSCNTSGDEVITNIDQLPGGILAGVEVVVDGGVLNGKASVIVDYSTGKVIRH